MFLQKKKEGIDFRFEKVTIKDADMTNCLRLSRQIGNGIGGTVGNE